MPLGLHNWPEEPSANGRKIYLTYFIISRDVSDCEALRATYGGDSVLKSPGHMRDVLGISETNGPWIDPLPNRWITFSYPPAVVRRAADGTWLAPIGNEVAHAVLWPHDDGNPDEGYYWPPTEAQYRFNYDFDWIEWPNLFFVPNHFTNWQDVPTVFIWVGMFLTLGGESSVTTPPPATFDPIRPRRWLAGFELLRGGEGEFSDSPEGLSVTGECYSRDASRTLDGIGLAMRDGNSNGALSNLDILKSPIVNPMHGVGSFYMRVRKYPTASNEIWRVSASNSRVRLLMTSAGTLQMWTRDNFGNNMGPKFTSSVMPLNTWMKIGYEYYSLPRVQTPTVPPAPCGVLDDSQGNTGCNANLHLFIAGNEVISGFGSVHIGFGTNTVNWTQEGLASDGAVTYEIDFDDWIGIEPAGLCRNDPLMAGNDFRHAVDWFFGYHLQAIRPTALVFAANWTGNWQALLQNPSWLATDDMRSTTAAARIEVNSEMNGAKVDDAIVILRQMGCLALTIGTVNNRQTNTGTDGKLGYKVGAGADVLKTLTTENIGLDGYAFLSNFAAGQAEIPTVDTIEPLNIIKTHSTQLGEDRIKHLQVLAQFMGSFGPEDELDPDNPLGITDMLGIHNAPYFTSLIGREITPTTNIAGLKSDTYVGNGTVTSLIIELMGVHWFYIRNTATGDQVFWFSGMIGPHFGRETEDILSNDAVKFEVLIDGTTKITITGSHVAANANSVTYQYVALSDPLSIFMLNGAFKHVNGSPLNNPLFNPDFIPEAAFFFRETNENNLAGNGAAYKGPGFSANGGKNFGTTAEDANCATFSAGNIASRSLLHGGTLVTAFNAWRQNFGSGPIITSYVGDGAGSKVVTLALNGLRPLFAFVTGVTTASQFMRDPSHTGTNSNSALATVTSATAITAGGINSITVGITLNVNGVTYSVFVVPACTDDAGNNGWGVDGICSLNQPGWTTPLPPYLPPPPAIPADVSVIGEGGLVLSGNPAKTLILNPSGLYTLVENRTHDTLLDRQVGQTSASVPIPNPHAKTGFIGG